MNEGNKLKDVGEICCDDRFEIIARAKAYIIKATNIETSADEMKVIDNFLFRLWQLGWLNMFGVKHADGFKKELTSLLNRYGWDGACETPDHILADYVERCLNNYCSTIGINMAWHNWKKISDPPKEEE